MDAGRHRDGPATVVHRVLTDGGAPAGTHPPGTWLAFDQQVRQYATDPLYDPRQERAGTGSDLPAHARTTVRLCHASGRIREAALGEAGEPPELVAIRTTDWVPQVRDRARRMLGASLAADPVGTLRVLTPLALALGRRVQGRWVLERFEEAFRGEGAAAVAALCDSSDRATRRFAARLTVEAGGAGVRELAHRAAAEHDAVTALVWCDAALAALAAADGADRTAVDALLGARLPLVRAGGVTALRRAGRAAEAAPYLTDRSGLVRACARWLVRQNGGDPDAHYRAALSEPAGVSAYAVTGFCEGAERADVPLVRGYLDHPVGAVRAAALAGLRHLDAAIDEALLLTLLDDPTPAVTREASLTLLATAGRPDPDVLMARVGAGKPSHTRRAAFRLLRAGGGVAALRAAVALATDPDPKLGGPALALVRGWDWRRTLWEGEADAAELSTLLTRSAPFFDAHELALRRGRLGPVGEGAACRTGVGWGRA